MENVKVKTNENITESAVAEELEKIIVGKTDSEEVVVKDKPEKPTGSTRTRSSSDTLTTQDKIEKIRAVEQAKLEALKEREREKTRLAIEKERERLEKELQNEIRQLETQLQLTRSSLTDEPLGEIPKKEAKPAPVPRSKKKAVTPKKEAAEPLKAGEKQAEKEADEKPKVKTVKSGKTTKLTKTIDVDKQKPIKEVKVDVPLADKKEKPIKEDKVEVLLKDKEEKPVKEIKPELLTKDKEAKPAVEKAEPVDAPISNLQKLREQIMAQKQLEKELMEKEASKAQEQDKTISERIARLGMLNAEEGDQLISVEELEEQRQIIEGLKAEKIEFQTKISNLYSILDKLLDLQLDGINIMDTEDYRLSAKFVDTYEKRKQRLTAMEQQILKLERICSENAHQIDEAEKAYLRLQETHQLQAKRIAEISEQIDGFGDRRPAYSQPEAPSMYRDYPTGYRSSDIAPLYRELDNLQRELNRLVSSVEYNQRYDSLRIKEREIENLRFELERKIGYGQAQNIPYYSPPHQPPITNRFEPELKEIKQKEEFTIEISKIKDEIAEIKAHQLQSHKDSIEIMKEVQSELNRSREDRKIISEQQERDIESYKEQLEQNEKDKASLLSEREIQTRKIEYLEKEIEHREKTLNEMKQRLDQLSEDDIIDPDFKRRIRVVRDMEKDILNRLAEEEKFFQRSLDEFTKKIDDKKKIIDDIRANLDRLDRNYQNNPDKSSSARDLYERTKGKSLIEFQLQRESLSDLEEDYNRAEKKYQDFNNSKKSELSKVKAKEAEIVEYYLNRLRKEIQESEGFRPFRSALQEREDLQQQLEDLKTKPVTDNEYPFPDSLDDSAIGFELKTERKDQIELYIDKLEEAIRSETLTYNQYHQKITDLKIELEKRIEYEKQLRSKEEDVSAFYSHKLSINESLKQLQSIKEQIEEKQSKLIQVNEDPMLRTEYLRQKAEISDLEVHKNDIEVKIDYYQKTIRELEGKAIIDTYMKLINQINQIRDANKEIRENAEQIKQSIQQKTRQLEQMKEKLRTL
ncbi:MAG: hypothetical protein PHT03_04095 [Bacilli bacterium]|nr:hypothetical protein [Bacilli bacterium]